MPGGGDGKIRMGICQKIALCKISLLRRCHHGTNTLALTMLFYSYEEAIAIRRIFSPVDMITKAKFPNSPNDFKIRLFG